LQIGLVRGKSHWDRLIVVAKRLCAPFLTHKLFL